VPDHPWHDRFAACYENSFWEQRRGLGLGGQNFDHFFQGIESFLGVYPWEYSQPVPDGEGIRMLPTIEAAPDLPALYVYYRVEEKPNKIIFLGLSRAWSKADVAPPPFPDEPSAA